MDMTPQEIAGTTFGMVKKGFDPEEVRAFQVEAAQALEATQSQASLMEQRARAAVAKAQGLAASVAAGTNAAPTQTASTSSVVAMRADDAETISRTLVLAQRTAERAIADAEREAAEIRAAAEADAGQAAEQARQEVARLVTDARTEARRAAEAERGRITNEIQSLLARLDFLRGDVEEMEAHAAAHRRRLADAAEALRAASEQPMLGLADLKRPVLSPAADMERTERPAPAVVAAPVVVPAPATVVTETAPSERPAPPEPRVVVVAEPPAVAADTEVDFFVDDDLDVDLDADLDDYEDDDLDTGLVGDGGAGTFSDVTPGAGSPLLPPMELTFSDLPTGEIPRIRPTSGPVAVPDLDLEWDDEPAVEAPRRWPNDLRIVGEP